MSLLKNGEDIVNAISLISKNILPQDEQRFSDAIKSIPVKFTEGDWHSAFMTAEDGIEKLRGKPKTDLLQYVYCETYCGSCRERVARLIHKKGMLTDSLLQEWRYDSNSDVREFAERVLSRKK